MAEEKKSLNVLEGFPRSRLRSEYIHSKDLRIRELEDVLEGSRDIIYALVLQVGGRAVVSDEELMHAIKGSDLTLVPRPCGGIELVIDSNLKRSG